MRKFLSIFILAALLPLGAQAQNAWWLFPGSRQREQQEQKEQKRTEGETTRQQEEVQRRDEPVYLSDLIIKGSDLLAAGVNPGPHMGEILSAMLEDVLRTPVHNSILYLLSQYVK